MRLGLKEFMEKAFLGKSEENEEEQPDFDMVALVEQAKQDWLHAANYFNNVSDPELVDHAILLREAAERRYMYLLKQAKLANARAFTLSTDEPA
ncbi:MAG: DUF2508 family protein [Firmicutes bacterium]|nr:DUF2508 family protein [Bacillota bacterium]